MVNLERLFELYNRLGRTQEEQNEYFDLFIEMDREETKKFHKMICGDNNDN